MHHATHPNSPYSSLFVHLFQHAQGAGARPKSIEEQEAEEAAAVQAATAAMQAQAAGAQDGQQPPPPAQVPTTPPSPFAPIRATMGWSTFHMCLTLFLGQVDVPARSSEKKWEVQVRDGAPFFVCYKTACWRTEFKVWNVNADGRVTCCIR